MANVQRRSNNTTAIVIGVLVAVMLCGVVLCGGIAVAGGALLYIRSRAGSELVQTVPRQLRPTPKPFSVATPVPLQVTPSVMVVPATPEAVITVTPVVSVPASADAISTTTVLTFTAEDTARQLSVFDGLWDVVNESYVYTDYNGLDWAAVRITVEQEISAGIPNETFYDLMRGVVVSLPLTTGSTRRKRRVSGQGRIRGDWHPQRPEHGEALCLCPPGSAR
jgi:hypothetical protein